MTDADLWMDPERRREAVAAAFGTTVARVLSSGTATAATGPVWWVVTEDLVAEVEIDVRERAVFVLVSRPVDGGRATGYYRDDSGVRVRWHLGELLVAIGADADASELRRATRRSGNAAMQQQARLGLELVAEHLDALGAELRRRHES